jgi:DNA-binding NarL/FixJ family response regulator
MLSAGSAVPTPSPSPSPKALVATRSPVSVLITRFEDIVGLGLRALVDGDPYLELVAADVDHSDLGVALGHHSPSVAVLNFGSLVSAAEVRELHGQFPETRLLILANRPQPNESRQLLSFGATACLAKSTEARDVLHAIHLASRGLQVLPPSTPGRDAPIGPELLTPREAEVLQLLQRGCSNAEIANELHVGIETVRTHTRRVYRKLGIRTRRELRDGPVR